MPTQTTLKVKSDLLLSQRALVGEQMLPATAAHEQSQCSCNVEQTSQNYTILVSDMLKNMSLTTENGPHVHKSTRVKT